MDKTSLHYKGEFKNIYEVHMKYPNGGAVGDFVDINGFAHYWNANRGTWSVNENRDQYWDELFADIIKNGSFDITVKDTDVVTRDNMKNAMIKITHNDKLDAVILPTTDGDTKAGMLYHYEDQWRVVTKNFTISKENYTFGDLVDACDQNSWRLSYIGRIIEDITAIKADINNLKEKLFNWDNIIADVNNLKADVVELKDKEAGTQQPSSATSGTNTPIATT